MEIKKLMRVLVLGGAAIAATRCGPAGPDTTGEDNSSNGNPQNQNSDGGVQADGGTQADGGEGGEGGGPPGW